MASLLKFKLLATQCGVTQSPTLSPRTSPMVHLRRRKTTLRMLLSRNTSRRWHRRTESSERTEKVNGKESVQRNTLKDLFVSSPPVEEKHEEIAEETATAKSRKLIPTGNAGMGGGSTAWRTESGSQSPVWTGFRYRFLLRKAWRPMLITIPE